MPLVDGTNGPSVRTGRDAVLHLLTHNLSVDEADGRSWANGTMACSKNPPNAHYFFIVAGSTDDHASFTDPLADDVAAQLGRLDESDQAWWADQIHVVAGSSMALSGFVKRDSRQHWPHGLRC